QLVPRPHAQLPGPHVDASRAVRRRRGRGRCGPSRRSNVAAGGDRDRIDAGGGGMTRRRGAFPAGAAAIALLGAFAALLAIDVYLHSKYERSAGFNVWGYRGPAVGRRQPGEYRIAVLGGSSAFGYGVTWDRAIPARLEQDLGHRAAPGRTFRVVNLGYNNEGAYSF